MNKLEEDNGATMFYIPEKQWNIKSIKFIE